MKIEGNKGITLISLVVTIIILLILVGITIRMLTGENGIIGMAIKAKHQSENSSEKEQIELAYLSLVSEQQSNSVKANDLQQTLQKNGIEVKQIIGEEKLAIILDNNKIYEINKNGNIEFMGTYIDKEYKEPLMMSKNDEYGFWQEEYRTKITKIYAKPYVREEKNIKQEWDVSTKKDKSVMAYIIDDNTGGYELYIVANGIIKLNPESSSLFANFYNANLIDLSYVDTTKVINMWSIFFGCEKAAEIDISSFRTPNLKRMYRMFQNCKSLKSLDLNNFDTSQVDNFVGIFLGCESLLDLRIEKLNTSKAISMLSMFSNCKSLKTLNVSNFNTSNVKNMQYMFESCISLEKLNISNFDTSNVNRMDGMFEYCTTLEELDLSNFNTSRVISISVMFHGCKNLAKLDLRNFNLNNVTYYTHMIINLPMNVNIVTNQETANWLINRWLDLEIVSNQNNLYIVSFKQ